MSVGDSKASELIELLRPSIPRGQYRAETLMGETDSSLLKFCAQIEGEDSPLRDRVIRLSMKQLPKLALFARRMAAASVQLRDSRLLEAGVVALALVAGSVLDKAETLTGLALFERSSQMLGIDSRSSSAEELDWALTELERCLRNLPEGPIQIDRSRRSASVRAGETASSTSSGFRSQVCWASRVEMQVKLAGSGASAVLGDGLRRL